MFGMGWGEMLVVALVALFVLGPERLPGAIRTATAMLRQARGWMDTAKEQLDTPEMRRMREPLDDLRAPLADLRAADPRRAVRGLFDDAAPDTRAAEQAASPFPRRRPSAATSERSEATPPASG